MSLPTEAVERLFSRLSATYGSAWDRARGTAPISDWKTTWGHELSGFAKDLNAIAWALENLPERCPNVIEFRNLCRQSPRDDQPLLEKPKGDPAKIAAELMKLGELRANLQAPLPEAKDWARRILRRQVAGDRVPSISVRFAKEALGDEVVA